MYLGGINREESLSRGTLFDDFTIRMDNQKSGRPKQVIASKGNGEYSIHWCYYCKQSKKVPLNILRIAHFNTAIQLNDTIEVSTSLKIYTSELQNVLNSM